MQEYRLKYSWSSNCSRKSEIQVFKFKPLIFRCQFHLFFLTNWNSWLQVCKSQFNQSMIPKGSSITQPSERFAQNCFSKKGNKRHWLDFVSYKTALYLIYQQHQSAFFWLREMKRVMGYKLLHSLFQVPLLNKIYSFYFTKF